MKFDLSINSDNAAFEDDGIAELAAILRATATRLVGSVDDLAREATGPVQDSNGNTVGSWRVQS